MSAEDDDALMKQLGAAARNAPRREPDPRWDEYAQGRMTAAELEALRETTASDEEFDTLEAAFRPLAPAERDAAIDRVMSAVAPSVVRSEHRARRTLARRAAIVTGVMLAAAAAVLLVRPSDSVSVPRYALRVEGGAQSIRGSAAPVAHPRFRSGSRVELLLQPEVAAEAAVGVVTFAEGTSQVVRWTGSWERAESGAFRLVSEASELFEMPDGDWTLVFVVAPASHLPSSGDAASALAAARADPTVQVLEAPIVLEIGR